MLERYWFLLVAGDLNWKSVVLLFCVLPECCATSRTPTGVFFLVCVCLLPLSSRDCFRAAFGFSLTAF